MFISPVIDTALSLVVLFFFFSVLVSCIQEGTVPIFKTRGKMLSFAIDEVLNDKFNKNFGYLLYQHPQIDLLKQKHNELPSYIEPATFSKALIDLIAAESTETVYHQADHTKDPTMAYSGKTTQSVSVQKTEQIKPELLQMIANQKMSWSADVSSLHPRDIRLFDKYRLGIETLQNSDLKKLLHSFLHTSDWQEGKTDLNHLEKQIEQWYTGYMERVTGWYKRKIRTNIFIASAIVTVMFNLNFIVLAKTIYASGPLRETLVKQAESMSSNPNAIKDLKAKYESAGSLKDINIESIIGAQLPIGWDRSKKLHDYEVGDIVNWTNILGWIIFALALSRGAPFWFDVMKKAVNMRNSGIAPSSSAS